jgi:hypothetical protein
MKLLLHTCCAPCLIYPLERLRQEGFAVTGFFYNPNIHPLSEYEQRKQALVELGRELDTEVIYPEYNPAQFFQAVNLKETAPQRCSLCWELRLKATARAAQEKGCAYFSTTLLVSPYQDQELLNKIGSEVAREEDVDFYYQDFRPGFRKAQAQAKAKGIYCQKYCGCIYSMKPRLTERK